MELWKTRPDGSQFERVPLVGDPACRRTEYSSPTVLPNGDLGLVWWCFGAGIHQFLESYDWESGRQERLVREELPFNPQQFTVRPGTRSGFLSTLSDICGTIAAFDNHRVRPLRIRISDHGRSWSLARYLQTAPARPCTDQGRADWPTLTRDGQLAFFASGPKPGVHDFDRVDLPWSLFVTDSVHLAPDPMFSGVTQPRGLTWSPDGRWLAFSGGIDGRAGTWLLEPTSHRLVRVSDISADDLAWSPDGRQIVGLFNPDPGTWPPKKQVLIFELTSAIS